MALPKANEVSKYQNLLTKNPIAFTTTIFFMMFGLTYFINIRKNNQAEQYWKELYIAEKSRNNTLTDQLLLKAGVIEIQNQVIVKADSTLKDNVAVKVQKLINNENN